MIDNFRRHSDDWSRVPRPEALGRQGYGVDSNTIRAFASGRYGQQVIVRDPIRLNRHYTAQVYADDYVVRTRPQLSVGIAYVLWLLFGLFGAHYFYLNKPGLGILWLLTGGLLGVGWLVDLFTLRGQVDRANRRG